MYNFIDSISNILADYKENESVVKQLINAEVYLAHTPNGDLSKPSETLAEHLDLVQDYFEALVKIHGLDEPIDGLIFDYLASYDVDSVQLAAYLKKVFVHSICYHDHGKVNENFQASPEKMNNPFFRGKENSGNTIGKQHSTLSSFIFLSHKIDEALNLFKGKEQVIAMSYILMFSYPIYKHHGKYLDDDFLSKLVRENLLADKLEVYLSLFKKKCNSKIVSRILLGLEKALPRIAFSDYARSFHLYQLIRLNFSLLTASDYLATNEYMNKSSTTDFGVLSKERIDEIFVKVSTNVWLDKQETKRNFNEKTYQQLAVLSLKKPTEKSNENLNLLRQQMATEAIRNIRLNHKEKLFYIEAPTGGGKTNISMLVTLELLKLNPDLNKVYYVFPFTTLIDQTYKSIKQNLGLGDDEIVALHSKAAFGKEEDEDDDYGQNRKNYINHLFLNYPFSLLSHIKFFEILKTNAKEQNYILHRLANSVVVIDELQTYAPQHWDKVIYLVQKYAQSYNISFVIMSATLPKLHRLNIEVDTANFVYLLQNARTDYFQNTNFKDRVSFNFELAEKKIHLTELAEKLLNESKKYSLLDYGQVKPKDSVYTIIEFIFKKSSTEFYNEIQKINDGFFEEVFVLSGTILEHRRRHIINFLKRKENRKKRILLITTQVVEAGVDIDMDLGFKDKSLLDSDEQLAGRINRNVGKENCQLFLFNYNKEALIYGEDYRLQVTRNLSKKEQQHILESKDFDLLYDKVIAYKNCLNLDEHRKGFNDYLLYINKLKFESVQKQFKLIEQENLGCFIPMKIPIAVKGETIDNNEEIFTTSDLRFLSSFEVLPDVDYKICGEEVFDLYIDLINGKNGFLEKRIQLKQIQSILSKFVFSLFKTNAIESQLIHFSDMEKSIYGYYYVENWNGFYKEAFGIDDKEFKSVETQFL
ncbi:hypothetical protein KCTC52924_02621 [Arenibacter antarcticus]|uniref:CRISPR-associated helicase Cas3 n=1 Tax=Arenibacter antarcticus TaxID=2040469 RepID=A0ABW5VMV0_9FLAO|nr:CRISPR-associated helicase Cas3' [Arenibacter sp. H213]MCM4168920.1 hypothetical protein [Arenibacter sp. H213]